MDLTDEQWAILEPLIPPLPVRAAGKGRPWKPTRDVLNGILWVMRTRAPWKDMPGRYPQYATCHRRFSGWVRDGTLRKIVEAPAIARWTARHVGLRLWFESDGDPERLAQGIESTGIVAGPSEPGQEPLVAVGDRHGVLYGAEKGAHLSGARPSSGRTRSDRSSQAPPLLDKVRSNLPVRAFHAWGSPEKMTMEFFSPRV